MSTGDTNTVTLRPMGLDDLDRISSWFWNLDDVALFDRTLPLPARVRVTNLGNGRSVILRVNDRGPFIEGRVLVLGDHRGNSRDGRWFGTVPVAELYGRASGVFWRGATPMWQSL